MSGLRFSSSDDMHKRVLELLAGAKPASAFDRMTLAEFKRVGTEGGVVTLAGDLPDPIDDYERHIAD